MLRVRVMELDFEALVGVINSLLAKEYRSILGIVGCPGSGKSSLTQRIVERFACSSAVCVVGMDGFHLSNKVLRERNLRDVKGRFDTFDSSGFRRLLSSLKESDVESVFFPVFHRDIEESIACEGEVKPEAKVIIAEGLWLCHPDWKLSSIIDCFVFLDLEDEIRHKRLIKRRMDLGETEEEARKWACGSDEKNAIMVKRDKEKCQYIIR